MKARQIIMVSLAILLVGAVVYTLIANDAISLLTQIHAGYAALAAALILSLPALKDARFRILSRSLSLPRDPRSIHVHYVVPIIGMFTPGRLGEGAKIIMLSGRKRELGFIFIMERIYDAVTLLCIAAVAMASISRFSYAFIAIIGIIALGLVILHRIDWFIRIAFRKNILGRKWFMRNVRRISPGTHILQASLSLAGWAVNGITAYLIMSSLGAHPNPGLFVLLFLLSVMIGQVSGLPGGIGAREVSAVILFTAYLGIDTGIASAFAALNLIMNVLVLSVSGGLAYMAYRRSRWTHS